MDHDHHPPWGAATLLGIGLGGQLDGIVLHQLLQWHNMLSARVPPTSVEAMRVNMFADGVFHLATWLVVVLAVAMLLRAYGRRGAAWSGAGVFGAALFGWGLFNIVEGLVDHFWLGLHHVIEAMADPRPMDLAFLAFGGVLVVLGALIVAASRPRVPRERIVVVEPA